MGFPTKIQVIRRADSEQWYINFPAALAKAMEFEKGEMFEWIVEDKSLLALRREKVPGSALKKKRLSASSISSRDCSSKGAPPSPKSVSSRGPKGSR